MLRRWPIWLLVAVALLIVGTARATPTASLPGASASVFGVTVSVPNQGVFGTTEVISPPDSASGPVPFVYPDDGSIVNVTSMTLSATTTTFGTAAGMGTADLQGISIFGGEISIEEVYASADAVASASSASSSTDPTAVTGATFMGQPLSPTENGRIDLADWGYMQTLVETVDDGDPGTVGKRQTLRALDIHVVADHGGLPAGSEIVIGGVDASAEASPEPEVVTIPKVGPTPAPSPTTTSTPTTTAEKPTTTAPVSKSGKKHKKPKSKSKVEPIPSNVHPKLSKKGRVFPVYGQSWFSDSFGAPRADTGWHHGIDIFAPVGTPIVAAADGTVFSVGWNNLGGNRFWLRDTDGNEYYYAHLSAYSPLAVNGKKVKAGDVIGFVGNSGDAITTPPHLHFEVHLASLVPLGYNRSAVDPYEWLRGLQHLRDVAFPVGTASWAKQIARTVGPQHPGAVLLHATDISVLPRLDNRSVESLLSSKPVTPSD